MPYRLLAHFLPVDFLSVPDSHNQDDKLAFDDLVDHAVATNPKPAQAAEFTLEDGTG